MRWLFTRDGRVPVTVACNSGHDLVSWHGSRVRDDEETCEPPCWVCGATGRSAIERFPYVPSPTASRWHPWPS